MPLFFTFLLTIAILLILMVVDFFLQQNGHQWWASTFSVLSNLTTGAITSFIFYYLLVVIPEKRRHHFIRVHTLRMYRSLKEDLIYQVVRASIQGGRSDLTAQSDEIKRLMNSEEFYNEFRGGSKSTEGFYAFENQMMDRTHEFKRIILIFWQIHRQIEYLLNHFSREDDQLLSFFKRLDSLLIELRVAEPGYNESKPLCRFIWEICAGFNIIDGHVGYDIIERRIEQI